MQRPAPSVSILLATYQGGAFLKAQLHSINQQDFTGWDVILSDDGSSDDTVSIARAEIEQSRLRVLNGPRKGLTQNFGMQ